ADNTVTGGDILDGTILTGDIGTDTILAGNIAAGAVSDSEVSSLSWSELANYPSACTSSQTITALEDTITCTAIGNAATSTALAANGGNCAAGSYPLGIDASGASESCTTAAAHSLCTGSNAGTGLSMTATYYIGGCADGASNTESFVRGPVPARTFKNLRVYGSSDDGGLGPTVTVLKNGVATALTCIVPTGGGVCSDTTNSFTTSAGDTISLSATRLSTWVAYSIEMQP
ncbi:hypothetical protein HYT53_00960, partial [Candidatus Woesearchaeota archaeon]|nr:hypothetical protein [Candidatus Woesearchaeota archaeon]